MCYTQLFNLLCEKADDVYGGRLPVHVRCLIDECANIQNKSALIPSDEIRSEELLAEQKFEAFITSLAHIIEKYGMRVLGEVDGAA